MAFQVGAFQRGAFQGAYTAPTFYPHRYVIEVRDSSGVLLVILKDTYGITLEESVNAPTALTFLSPADDAKLANITRANELWVRDMETFSVIANMRLLRDDDTR